MATWGSVCRSALHGAPGESLRLLRGGPRPPGQWGHLAQSLGSWGRSAHPFPWHSPVLTRHSQAVHASRFHLAPLACGSPSASVQSAVLSRDSSLFICSKAKRCSGHFRRRAQPGKCVCAFACIDASCSTGMLQIRPSHSWWCHTARPYVTPPRRGSGGTGYPTAAAGKRTGIKGEAPTGLSGNRQAQSPAPRLPAADTCERPPAPPRAFQGALLLAATGQRPHGWMAYLSARGGAGGPRNPCLIYWTSRGVFQATESPGPPEESGQPGANTWRCVCSDKGRRAKTDWTRTPPAADTERLPPTSWNSAAQSTASQGCDPWSPWPGSPGPVRPASPRPQPGPALPALRWALEGSCLRHSGSSA